ncbi:MAG: DUF4249 domain-containing protein [Bacteroidales bacterium]|nr:DUF4249 domain-containing protein [Bacteroidales bacterium]
MNANKYRKILPFMRLLFFMGLVPFFSSCEKVIDFDPGETTPYVVMKSRPTNDSLVSVYLSRSTFFLEDDYYDYGSYAGSIPYITDASVRLYVGSEYYDGTLLQDGDRKYYQFNIRPKVGDSLHVEATVPGYDVKVTAGTRIPSMPVVEIVDYEVEQDEYGSSPRFRLRFKIKSGSGREYYSLSLDRSTQKTQMDSVTWIWDTAGQQRVQCYFMTDDAIFSNTDIGTVIDGDDGSLYGTEMSCSNELFSNGEHLFVVEFGMDMHSYVGDDVSDMPVWLAVRSLSPELYKYNQTMQAQAESEELLAEPVQVICNVSGGIGVFGGMSQKEKRLPVARKKTQQ